MLIYTCKRGSTSAKKLGEAFKIPVKTLERGQQPEEGVFINWGCSWIDKSPMYLNTSEDINFLRNKIAVLDAINADCSDKKHLSAVPHTTQRLLAEKWSEEHDIVCRHLIKSTNSKGIELIEKGGVVPKAKLYTKFIPGNEYRVYFINGYMSSIYSKIPLQDFPCNKWKFQIDKRELFRNLIKGFMLPIEDIVPLFAADFIMGKDRIYILELNSSPILFPSVIKDIQESLQ